MTAPRKVLLLWEPHAGDHSEAARPLAQFMLQEAVRIAVETDESFLSRSATSSGITRDEFTVIVNETLYFLIAWMDVASSSLLEPASRHSFLDSLAHELQSFLVDDRLAFHPKYLARRELEPGIWLAGLDQGVLNQRQVEYGSYFTPQLSFPGAVSHLRRQVAAVSLAAARDAVGDSLELAAGNRLSSSFGELERAVRSAGLSRRLTSA